MKLKTTHRHFLALVGSSLLAISSASAANLYWDGGSADILTDGNGASAGTAGTWDTTLLNWDAGASPHVAWNNSNNDTAVFAGTAGIVTLGTPITVGGLIFNTTGYSITGSTLTLAGASAPVISAGTSITATISGDIAGTNGLEKTGAGTVILSGTNNTYSGTTTVTAGTLEGRKNSTGGASPFGTSTIQLNAGTLNSLTVSANDNVETFTFGNDVNVGGSATISFGRVGGVGSSKTHAYGNLSIGNSTLSLTAGLIGHTLSFTGVNLTGNAVFNGTTSNATTNMGAVTETGGPRNITKSGGNTLRLLGTNTYTGTTTISGGTLEVQGSIASSSGIINNATLTFNSGSAQSYANVISGSGSLTKSGSGTTTLSGDNTFTGNLSVSAGTLVLSGLNSYTGSTRIGTTTSSSTAVINTLKNYGVASSLGAAASGDITFFKQAVNNLVYVGSGDTTNRTIRHEADVSNRNNGSGIYNNGSGALIFNGSTFNTPFVESGNGGRTTILNLGGTYTGDANEIRGVIANNDATSFIGITKNADTSIWQFSGANTYSGINTISGGSLIGTQTSGTPFGIGAVTINAGMLSLAPTGSGSAVSVTGGTRAAGTLFTYNAGAAISLARGLQDSLTYTFGGTGNTTARGTNGTLILSTTNIANFGAAGTNLERFIMNGTAPTQVNTLVSGVVIQDRNTSNAGDFATYDATNGFTKASYTHTDTFTASTNVSRVEITSATNTGSIASYAIKANATVTNSGTITLGSSGNPAALILNGGSISGGTLAAANANSEFVIYTSGASSISSAITTSTSGMSLFGPGSLTLSSSNSFTGGLRVNNSTLVVTNDNQLGGANNALTLRGGTLQTSGASLAIGAGARAITLAAGQDQTGGTFDVSSGTTTFQNNSASARVISGTGSLTKTGAGILELTGNTTNTYTGQTMVAGGTLKLGANDVLPNGSAVSIGTATLDADTRTDTLGTLDVTGSAVINLGSGAALAFADSSAVGAGTWAGTLNITGTLGATSLKFGNGSSGLSPAQLAKISVNGGGLGTYTLDASGYLIPGGGGDVTPPTLTSITDDKSGGPVAISTQISYTVTFSEDIDAASVSASDFDNNGTAGMTVVSITETSPGVFTVLVTPTSSGTLKLRIPTGAIVKDVAGINLVVPVADDTTITVQTPYESWAGGAAFDADTNGDGVSNGLAFLLGASGPTVNALNKLPMVSQSGGNLVLSFQSLKDAYRGSASLSVEHSSDLGLADSWLAALVSDAGTASNNVTFSINSASTTLNNVTATISSSEAFAGRLFGRVRGVTP
jgi:autotransporter-associated beta strand protein